MLYREMRKKELIKNFVYITFILLIAVVSTYYIYYNFQVDSSVDFNSDSLEVVYHEKTLDKLSIEKVIKVTDSVGLSSKSYNFSITNNLTEKANFKVKIVDDLEEIVECGCGDKLISKDNIRVSIKNGKTENKIYTLSDLKDGILLNGKLDALEKRDFSVRVWIMHDSNLVGNEDFHYHGKIQVIDNEDVVAINE